MTDKKKSPEEIEVTSFFNEFSERYEDEAFRQSPGLLFISEKELEAVKNFIEPTPSESSKQRGWALDIGVGTGRFSRLLCGMGYSTVGIDLSIEMLKQARNNVNGLEVVLASADMLPFKDEVFSRVVCIRVLKYVPDWKHAIENAFRVMHPTGKYVVEIANLYSIAYLGLKGANYRLFKMNEVINTINAVGFTDVKRWCGVRLPFPAYVKAPLWLLRGVERLLTALLPQCILSKSTILCGKKPDKS